MCVCEREISFMYPAAPSHSVLLQCNLCTCEIITSSCRKCQSSKQRRKDYSICYRHMFLLVLSLFRLLWQSAFANTVTYQIQKACECPANGLG